MDYYIVMPAHNEEEFLSHTLKAIVGQTLLPKQLVIVNDNSTDQTEAIIDQFTAKYHFIRKVTTKSSDLRLPGSKVINAFNAGLGSLDEAYDFIVKLDADLILPPHYFETIANVFNANPKVGIAGGFFHEQGEHGNWEEYHPMDRDHVRGAFKAYSRACFRAIGGLRNAMGWDTVDELLAMYHGFELYTDKKLAVKNLRPVGSAYDKEARYLQGMAMYRMHYGFTISVIASLKLAWHKKNPGVLLDCLTGYLRARKKRMPYLVTEEEGKFIRRFRWNRIYVKLFQGNTDRFPVGSVGKGNAH